MCTQNISSRNDEVRHRAYDWWTWTVSTCNQHWHLSMAPFALVLHRPVILKFRSSQWSWCSMLYAISIAYIQSLLAHHLCLATKAHRSMAGSTICHDDCLGHRAGTSFDAILSFCDAWTWTGIYSEVFRLQILFIMRILAPLASTVLFRTVLGALYVAPQTLPRTEYDFIVVGGNFSWSYSNQNWCIFVSRNSRQCYRSQIDWEPQCNSCCHRSWSKVYRFHLLVPVLNLLLPSDDDIIGLEIPLISPVDLSNTSYLWPYNTVPQGGLDGRQIPIQRGKVLGGSSSVSTCNV